MFFQKSSPESIILLKVNFGIETVFYNLIFEGELLVVFLSRFLLQIFFRHCLRRFQSQVLNAVSTYGLDSQGSTFPGAYALRFCCGPQNFSD